MSGEVVIMHIGNAVECALLWLFATWKIIFGFWLVTVSWFAGATLTWLVAKGLQLAIFPASWWGAWLVNPVVWLVICFFGSAAALAKIFSLTEQTEAWLAN